MNDQGVFMRAIFLLISVLSFSANANVICDVRMGDAVGGKSYKKTVVITKSQLVEFKGETLVGTVQYIDGMLAQMMIEDTKNYTFSQLDQKDLIEQGKGNFTFQNHKNDGEYMSMRCEVTKK